jgi:hypothetical protein
VGKTKSTEPKSMSLITDTPTITLTPTLSPRMRCPLCGWSRRKDDRWACSCGHLWHTFGHRGSLPRLSSPVD